jgi:hypothetical protein
VSRVSREQAILVAVGVLVGAMVTLGVMVLIESGRVQGDIMEREREEWHYEGDDDDDSGEG